MNLTEIATDLWICDARQRYRGLEIGTRMTVVRLPSGELLLHNPVPFEAMPRSELESLGPVRAIVAASLMHHLHLVPCVEAFPDAQLYLAPGLATKRRDLSDADVLGDIAPERWRGTLRQQVVGGFSQGNEVVFLHVPTHTLIVTDLLFNMSRGWPWPTRTFFRLIGLYGVAGLPRDIRRDLQRHSDSQREIEAISKWDFDRIIMAHGEPIASGGRQLWLDAYRFLTTR